MVRPAVPARADGCRPVTAPCVVRASPVAPDPSGGRRAARRGYPAGCPPRAVRLVPRAVRLRRAPSCAGQVRGRVGGHPARCAPLPAGQVRRGGGSATCDAGTPRTRRPAGRREPAPGSRQGPAPGRGAAAVPVTAPRRSPRRASRAASPRPVRLPRRSGLVPCGRGRRRRGGRPGAWQWPEPGRVPPGRGVKARTWGTWTPCGPGAVQAQDAPQVHTAAGGRAPGGADVPGTPGRPVERQGWRAAGPDL